MISKSRRSFLTTAAGASAAGMLEWVPLFRIPAASAASTLQAPPGFPASIPLYQQAYRNWSTQLSVDAVWTCAPASAADVVLLANWAHRAGYRLRAKGMSHNWSPILLTNGQGVEKTVLVDTTQHLNQVQIDAGGAVKKVTAGAGATMDVVLQLLEDQGLGFAHTPAPGDITLGGLLAIGAHGTAIPAKGEARQPGQTYGSLSNTILSLTAVVWDGQRYALRTFDRSEGDIRAFLVHVGRAFVTEVTLQVADNVRLRCQSYFDIPIGAVLAPERTAGPFSLAALAERAGRVEVIWFPFTAVPWVKVWSIAPNKPWLSRYVGSPYNYGFANSIDLEQAQCIERINQGVTELTPLLCNLFTAAAGTGLVLSGGCDLWGWSKDTLLYVKPTTLPIADAGFAVVTARKNIQRVVHEFHHEYQRRLFAYQARGQYPMSAPIEIRINGLEQPGDVQVPGAQIPLLSASKPRPDHPEWDTCIWFNMGTMPAMPHANAFYSDLEQWIWQNYSGAYATVRPEWSKGWAYTRSASWADPSTLTRTIPEAFRAGQASDDWETARSILNRYDPHRLFSNPFLDTLFPA